MSARHIEGPHSLAAGRYRLQVRAPRHGFGQLLLVKPLPGYTVAQFKDDLVGAEGFPRARRNTRLFGGINLHAGRTGAMWETLFAGRYWLCGFTPPRNQRIPNITTIHVHGTPTVSRFPRTVAEVVSAPRLGLRLTRRSIPSTGRILVRNVARNAHSIEFMPLKPGFTYRDYLRYSRNTRGPLPVRIGGATTATGRTSPHVGFVLRYHLRPGRYVVLVDDGFLANPPNLRRFSSPLTVRMPSAEHICQRALHSAVLLAWAPGTVAEFRAYQYGPPPPTMPLAGAFPGVPGGTRGAWCATKAGRQATDWWAAIPGHPAAFVIGVSGPGEGVRRGAVDGPTYVP